MKSALETAYCFLHQKQRVYQYSTMDWQKDDIEQAIDAFVDTMHPDVFALITDGRPDFLRNHQTFAEDMIHSVTVLEKALGI